MKPNKDSAKSTQKQIICPHCKRPFEINVDDLLDDVGLVVLSPGRTQETHVGKKEWTVTCSHPDCQRPVKILV